MVHKPNRLIRLSPGASLARILEEPDLVRIIRALEPGALGQLIDHVGLEDSGEIVSLATTDQLVQLMDDDLWGNEQPGQDETFDADRFGLWLEVLFESGEEFVAQKLSEWPEDLVMLALYRHLLVVNLDELLLEMSGRNQEVDLTGKALDSCLYIELGEYQIISRRPEYWHVILAAVMALDEHQHDFLQRILERCCHLSREHIEQSGGLYEVLTSEEMLEADAAGDREERRAARGFIAPSSARSFLSLARVTGLQAIIDADQDDPLTRAYFRDLQADPGESPAPARTGIRTWLRDAGIYAETRPLARLASPADSPFRQALARLNHEDPQLYARRMSELAYLSNLLIAGQSISGRRYRPSEAAEAAVQVCTLGLLHLAGSSDPQKAQRVVSEESAVKLFRIGWHLSG